MHTISDFIIEDGILKEYVGAGGDVLIPEQVTTIGWEAFGWCRSLRSVTIPDSVTRIKKNAFYRCKNLEKVVLPNTVQVLPEKVFSKCESLKSITIPAGVLKIDSLAFAACESLETVTIRGAVKVIGKDAFAGCPQLRLVAPQVPLAVLKAAELLFPAACGFLLVPEQYPDPRVLSAYRKYITGQKKRLLSFLFRNDLVAGLATYDAAGKISKDRFEQDFFIPAQNAGASQCVAWLLNWGHQHISPEDTQKRLLRELNKDPFNVADMKKLWRYEPLSDSALKITGYKGSEQELLIPERIGKHSVITIGADALSPEKKRCGAARKPLLRAISVITVSCGIKAIGANAFRGCEGLQRIILPETVRFIGKDAFSGCDALTVCAPAGSYAEAYAKANSLPFAAL